MNLTDVQHHFDQLADYCIQENWRGHDPYDGLNAALWRYIPLPGKLARIAWIQLCKRSPVNFRPIAGVAKRANPKGHGLAVRALLRRADWATAQGEAPGQFEDHACALLTELDGMRSTGCSGTAWGYPFDWQSRAFFVPQGSPSVVCTTFVAQAYLDAYERFGDTRYLDTARRACDFILNDLARTPDRHDPAAFCFSYTQLDQTRVHNASLLGAALLARVYHATQEPVLRESAIGAAKFSIRHQRKDGSWPYGEAPNQQWIDSFHTGFNLICLDEIRRFADFPEAAKAVDQGFHFYCRFFFLPDGKPKYYHNRLYPIDIHAAAQAFVTLAQLKHQDTLAQERLESCLEWTLNNMRSPNGYFYFQKTPLYTNRLSYLRWSQTWMLFGLSALLRAEQSSNSGRDNPGAQRLGLKQSS